MCGLLTRGSIRIGPNGHTGCCQADGRLLGLLTVAVVA